MHRAILFFLFIFVWIPIVYGQTNMERFKELSKTQNFKEQEILLRKWEAETPDDPDLYIAYFNYYFNLSSSGLSISTEPPKSQSLVLTKPGSDKPVAFIGESEIDKPIVEKGLKYIDRGIEKFPNRLDMRFGKVYVLGRMREYSRFTNEIVKAVIYGKAIDNKWFWTDDKPLENPKDRMLSMVQDYVVQLFDSGDDQVKFIKSIAETVLQFYPAHVESLSNLSIYFIMNKHFDNALVPLLRAEKIAPTDPVILGNIALCYFRKHDRANAVAYYERFIKFGDARQRQDAETKLAEIKRWK